MHRVIRTQELSDDHCQYFIYQVCKILQLRGLFFSVHTPPHVSFSLFLELTLFLAPLCCRLSALLRPYTPPMFFIGILNQVIYY